MSEATRKPSVLLTELGGSSTGDELIYRAAIRRFLDAGWRVSLLCRAFPRSPLTAASTQLHALVIEDDFESATNPLALAHQFARRHPQAYLKTRNLVLAHDLVAVAPGGRFTSGYNNPRALLTSSVAIESGRPLVNLHQSFGPLNRRNHRALLAAVLAHSMVTLVRDDSSLVFLQRLGIPETQLVLTRDAAFAVQPSGARNIRYGTGINIRHGFNGHARADALREFLLRLRDARPQESILVYSTTHAPDAEVRAAADGLAEVQNTVPLPENALASPSSCVVNISDSFHGVIFSMMARRPVVACQTDFSTWKLQGTRTPGLPDFNVLPGFDLVRHVPALLRETLRAHEQADRIVAEQDVRLHHAREAAESGWRDFFQRLESVRAGVSSP